MPLIISGKEVVSFTGILPVELGGTGATNPSAAINNMVPNQVGQEGKFLTTDGTTVRWATVAGSGGGGEGTVTSISLNTASTGLQVNGSNNATISSSGTFTISGSLNASSGGTGQTVYQIGDILYASSTTGLSRLPIGGVGQVLTVGPEGPQWEPSSSGATNEITNTDGVNTWSVSVATTGVISMNTGRGGLEFGAMPEVGGPSHLHIMRPLGQETSTDLYFGDDYNYIKMPGIYGTDTNYHQGVEIGSSLDPAPANVWRFGTNGALDLPANGVIRNKTEFSKEVNIVANNYVQLQWTTDAGVASDDPNNTLEPTNWLFVDEQGVWAESNVHGTGPSHKWHFGMDSELTFPRGTAINEGSSVATITPPGGSEYYLTARSSNAPPGDSGIFSASIRSLDANDPALVLSFSKTVYPNLNTTINAGDHVTVNGITMQIVSITDASEPDTWSILTNYHGVDPQSSSLPNIFKFSSAPPVSWTFGSDGVLKLPLNGDIKDNSGNSVLQPKVQTLSSTATNILNDESGEMNIDSGKAYIIYKIETNVPAWVRAYVSNDKRTEDAGRTIEEDPLATSGVVAEAVTTIDDLSAMFVPGVNGISFDTDAPNSLFIAAKNLSGSTTDITVTVTLLTLSRE